ncbi:DNA polymerase III subunit beta [Bacillus sp. mrc49]|uniref:DNA polymerase III subunit beta n=1 Tax=Bacillus sp. mrc49 TaxID=2054913 RepID=UPI000C277EB7|nr:DNA polymerase III subunit beta [Bacillus sp. mrc49]PJN89016.1 DNA polymerase III subunit beta [Bacillus sp. mrc49]
MEFMVNKNCLHQALSAVGHAISTKTTPSILTGIKIVANVDGLILLGSNSDIIIEKTIPVTLGGERVLEVYDKGSVVLPAKYLSDIIQKLSDDIHVKLNANHSVTIKSAEIVTDLNGFNSTEYPDLPFIDDSAFIEVHSEGLQEIIKQTAFAVSKSESRPALAGVNMTFKENLLCCVATNSHRLASSELALETKITGSFIVPSKSLNELTKLMNDEAGVVHIFVSKSYVGFKSSHISLFTRLIEGSFPNVLEMLPRDSKTTVIMDTNKLLKGVDRACLFARDCRNNNVHLDLLEGNKLQISSNLTERGKIKEIQTINGIKGVAEVNVSLDGYFLLDALKVIKEKEVKLSFGGAMKPVLIEPVDGSSQLHFISPVRSPSA